MDAETHHGWEGKHGSTSVEDSLPAAHFPKDGIAFVSNSDACCTEEGIPLQTKTLMRHFDGVSRDKATYHVACDDDMILSSRRAHPRVGAIERRDLRL